MHASTLVLNKIFESLVYISYNISYISNTHFFISVLTIIFYISLFHLLPNKKNYLIIIQNAP